jgi:OmpR family response regulator RpaB
MLVFQAEHNILMHPFHMLGVAGVLELLLENTGNYLSRTKILDNIWGYTPERHVDTRIVDVHISRLRAKIEENPRTPDLIITARGKGYKFQVD